jgi:hypothetical protein
MVVILDDRTSKPPLPDMANAAVPFVVMPRMGHGQGLHNSADGLARPWSQQEMEMIAQQAIAIERERIALLGLDERV